MGAAPRLHKALRRKGKSVAGGRVQDVSVWPPKQKAPPFKARQNREKQ